MLRRALAITVLTSASLFFASRFHGPQTDPSLAAEDPGAPLSTTTTYPVGTTSTVPRITTTVPTTTTTTIIIPDDLEDAVVFEGARTYTNWGWVKVEIKVLDGVMVDIEMVMIPHATKRSEALTAEYEPVLRQQALTAQSPRVDVITGATVISQGYRISLAAAMRDAGLWPPAEG